MMSPIKSLYGRRTTAGIINIPSVSGCGFLPNSATSFLLPGKPISLPIPNSLSTAAFAAPGAYMFTWLMTSPVHSLEPGLLPLDHICVMY